jgi:hypothetical protein
MESAGSLPSQNSPSFLVIGPIILVYIFIENQQMHKNYCFIVMLSQTFLHVSEYQRHHQRVHMILCEDHMRSFVRII